VPQEAADLGDFMRSQTLARGFAAVLLSSILAACGGGGVSIGPGTGGSSSGSGSSGSSSSGSSSSGSSSGANVCSAFSVKTVDLLTSSPQLPSGASTSASGVTITAIVKDASNNLITGAPVSFAADAGALQVVSATTDATGQATAVLSAGTDRANQVINVSANSCAVPGKLQIPETGTAIGITGPAFAGSGAPVSYTVKLTDSTGAGISNQAVSVTSANGGNISPASTNTDFNGKAVFSYTAGNTAGTDSLTATATGLNATASQGVTVSSANLVFTSPTANAIVRFGQVQSVVAHYTEGGVAVAGKAVTFSTSKGQLSSNSATTDASGNATVSIQSNGSSGPGGAIITATVAGGPSNSVGISFSAVTPAAITVSAASTVITTAQSTSVTATVKDASQNVVQGITVDFTLVDNTGGTLSAGSAVTDPAGNASITYTASNATSAQNGVQINASVDGQSSINTDANPVLITVGGKAYFIKLITTNLVATDPNDITAYQLPYSVKVQDSAGNPPPVGTPVNLQISSVSYQKGFYYPIPNDPFWAGVYSIVATDNPASDDTDTFGCLSEDTNNDGTLDNGEVDYNGNGKVDPGIVASVPSTVTTDTQVPSGTKPGGTAPFVVTYGKNYANWVRVRLTATTTLGGTPFTAVEEFNLPLLAGDANQKGIPPPGSSVQVPASEYYGLSGLSCTGAQCTTGFVSANGSPLGVSQSCKIAN
jgi:hypothetical protein